MAISFWMERVSPVFDVAKHLLLLEIEDSAEIARRVETIDETDLVSRAHCLADLGVDVLICGAISRPMRLILETKEIEVIGHICGNIEEIIRGFVKGCLHDEQYLMPGCRIGSHGSQPATNRNGTEPEMEEHHMRVAITSQGPDLSSQIDPRFGRARYLTVIDVETEEFLSIDNSRNLNATQGAGIQTVKAVVKEGVDVVMTGHVGPKANDALEAAGVEVMTGVSGTVSDVLKEFNSDRLNVGPKQWVSKGRGGLNAKA